MHVLFMYIYIYILFHHNFTGVAGGAAAASEDAVALGERA